MAVPILQLVQNDTRFLFNFMKVVTVADFLLPTHLLIVKASTNTKARHDGGKTSNRIEAYFYNTLRDKTSNQ